MRWLTAAGLALALALVLVPGALAQQVPRDKADAMWAAPTP